MLDAARDLFLRHGYAAVSVRQLAAAAGVNPAMVTYYFEGKQGLYGAMLQEVIGPLSARIDSMLSAPETDSPDLPGFLDAYMRVIAAHPWLPGMLLRDVFAPDGKFREYFVRDFAGRLAPRVAALVERGLRQGRLRAGLDPRLTVVSLLSLGLWPFLAMPVLTQALRFEEDQASIDRLIDHTVRLFAAGTAAGAKP